MERKLKMPLIYIVILNWNGLKDTLECLKFVYELDYPSFEVVVVDNGSSDKSVDIIGKTYAKVKLIINNKNYGFAEGCNIGIRFAFEKNADYVWLLNNDLIFPSDCLCKLVETAEKSSKIGLVSPIIYYDEQLEELQFAGSYVKWHDFSIIYPNTSNTVGREFQEGNDVCLWATALLIKRKVIERIGYFKSEYFAYWEDADYSIRALIAGFKNVVCTSSRIVHKSQFADSSGIKKGTYFYYYIYRNRLLLDDEYIRDFWTRLKSKRRYLADLLDCIGYCYKLSAHEHLDACLDGVWHGLIGISGEMNQKKGMPIQYKKIFLILAKHHPFFLADLIRSKFKQIFKMIFNRMLKIVSILL